MKHVLAIGVFDLFHIGHLRYLQFARAQGQHLSVAVCHDSVALTQKGKSPVISQDQRLEIIRGLGCVDLAALQPSGTNDPQPAAEWIQAWGIQHVVAGGCWSGSPRWIRLSSALALRGISVSFAPHSNLISSSQIIASIQKSTNPGFNDIPM